MCIGALNPLSYRLHSMCNRTAVLSVTVWGSLPLPLLPPSLYHTVCNCFTDSFSRRCGSSFKQLHTHPRTSTSRASQHQRIQTVQEFWVENRKKAQCVAAGERVGPSARWRRIARRQSLINRTFQITAARSHPSNETTRNDSGRTIATLTRMPNRNVADREPRERLELCWTRVPNAFYLSTCMYAVIPCISRRVPRLRSRACFPARSRTLHRVPYPMRDYPHRIMNVV